MAKGELISRDEFDALEKAVDEAFQNTPLNASDSHAARWQFCQLLESYSVFCIRRHFLDRKGLSDDRALIATLDNAKLSFDFGLKLIDRRLALPSGGRVEPDAFDVSCYLNLFNRGIENVQAYSLFFPARKAKTTFWRDTDTGALEVRTPLRTQQYWALQRLLPLEAKGFNPLWHLLVGLVGPNVPIEFDDMTVGWGEPHYALLQSVVREGQYLRTDLNFAAVASFYQHFFSLSSFDPRLCLVTN